ncbi:hypothetical protein [Streptantibioticus silvisoli]|uniref:DUF8094 domain-containing protein n=1 Tax=Streptantibioticus silvisoli TaxID=2705255 RepID=A0ABT6VT26_9ACTN|nr:hypothetical protein [Streptantibioticus silvisoli]MDI5961634.1 hypothetical protein [Streptantibioticus silvisoli]
MSAPCAVRPPLSPRRPAAARRYSRRLSALAAVLLLSSAATGCVTVHGRTALIPSVSKADARKALARFVSVGNRANIKLDPSLNSQVESGPMYTVDESYIRGQHTLHPNGNPQYKPLVLTDTRLLIPRQVGWPKWFVADTGENRDNGRWILVFTHSAAARPWTVSYLVATGAGADPDFATDRQGYAEPVPSAGTSLAVQPGELGARYAAYLHSGTGAAAFAPGPATTGARAERRAQLRPQQGVATQFADETGDPKRYPAVAVRLTDGGALVFFSSQTQREQTIASGTLKVTDQNVTAQLTSPVHKSITEYTFTEEGAEVPPAGARGGAAVRFLAQISQLIDARGA